MVGVPGRSKGCHTCRRRKKGCDLQRPTCGRCRKACIPCEGYSKNLTFYHHYVDGQRRGVGEVQPTSSSSSSSSSPSSSAELVKSGTFSRAADESGLEGLFWESYMPNGQSFALFHPTQRDLGGSISVIPSLLPGGQEDKGLLRMALGAMALRAAANREDTPVWMKRQGIKLYTAALVEARRSLASRRKPDLELLATSRVFSLYEALYGGDSGDEQAQYGSWTTHYTGDIALTVANSPAYFATGPAHRLFADGRLFHACCAITTRKRLIFSDPEWMTIPWTSHPKTRKDLLVDILFDIPALYEGIDEVNLQPDPTIQLLRRHNLKAMLDRVIQSLHDWNRQYGTNIPTTGIPGDKDWRLPPSENITSATIADAHVMTVYWAACIIVYDLFQTVTAGQGVYLGDDPEKCCRKIIHCVPVFLHPCTGIFRQHFLPVPLMTAARYLNSMGPRGFQVEREYLLSLCERPELTGMRRFMASLQPYITQILSSGY